MRWHLIPSHPKYEASDAGEIRRKEAGQGARAGHVLRSWLHGGYRSVVVWERGEPLKRRVHRLVAEAFLGPRPEGFEVNHRDGNRENNSEWNLEYVTRSENMRHAYARNPALGRREKNNRSVLTEADVATIRREYGTKSQRELAVEYGVSRSCIQGVVTGRNWA